MDIPEETTNMDKSYTISEVSSKLNLATKTLRRWEEAGRFKSSRTLGNQRRYNIEDLQILDAIKHNIIDKQSDLFTLPAAASLCNVSPSSIERWVKEGKIHPFITSGKTYYPKNRLIAKLDELAKQPSKPQEPIIIPLDPPPPPILPTPTPSLEKPKFNLSHFITKTTPLLNALVTILILLVYHLLTNTSSPSPTSPTASTEFTEPQSKADPPMAETPPYLTLLPITPPDPVPGTLYFDAGSQSLRLFTDTWTDLALPTDPTPPTTLSPENTTLISGTKILKKGTSNTLINHKSITPSTPIMITFTTDYSPGKKYWLEQSQGSFTLHTDYPVGQDSTFTYLILIPSSEAQTPSEAIGEVGPSPIVF